MLEDLRGKVFIVTGGATGIGKATALMLGKYGATVVVSTSRNIAGGEACANLVSEAGGKGIFVQCDVSKEEQVKKLIQTTIDTFARLDGAFNNAGIGPDGVRMKHTSIVDLSEEDWDKVMNVNFKGVFLCMKHEIKEMLRLGCCGAIVNTSSVGGIRMAPCFGAYGPSKAGVIALSRSAAVENAKSGIRINIVCPGPTTGTDLMANTLSTNPEEEAILKKHVIPMGQLGSAEKVAESVLWLLSDASSHTTGQIISVDGGMANL